MSFEERFASVGRWLDDRVYALSSTRRPRIRTGPSLGERLSESARSAQDWVASQKDKVSGQQLEQMDPKAKTALTIVSAMVIGGVLVGTVLYFVGPRGGSLSPEEVRALEKMKGTGAGNLFATPPPPPAGSVGAQTSSPAPASGTRPPPRGGGLLGGGR